MSEYQKAFICPYNEGPELDKKFYVPFNPSEITIQEAIGMLDTDEDDFGEKIEGLLKGYGMNWQHPLKTASARKKKNQIVLSATLFFNTLTSLYQDSYEDVRKYIRQLYPYTNRSAGKNSELQQIYFFWGSIAVAGMLTDMSVHYTMFAPDGKPVRAEVSISIEGDYVGEESPVNVNTGKAGTYTDWEGEGLSGFADPSVWKTLYKGIGNPRL